MAFEQLAEESAELVTAAMGVACGLTTASRFNHFATANRFRDFAATHWLDNVATGVAAAIVAAVEQFVEQTVLVASAARFGFAAARWSDFESTGWFTDSITAVTAAATKVVEEASLGADRAASDHSNREQTRNEYTTHRDSPWEGRWEGCCPRRSRNTSERPKPSRSTAPTLPQGPRGAQGADRRVAADATPVGVRKAYRRPDRSTLPIPSLFRDPTTFAYRFETTLTVGRIVRIRQVWVMLIFGAGPASLYADSLHLLHQQPGTD